PAVCGREAAGVAERKQSALPPREARGGRGQDRTTTRLAGPVPGALRARTGASTHLFNRAVPCVAPPCSRGPPLQGIEQLRRFGFRYWSTSATSTAIGLGIGCSSVDGVVGNGLALDRCYGTSTWNGGVKAGTGAVTAAHASTRALRAALLGSPIKAQDRRPTSPYGGTSASAQVVEHRLTSTFLRAGLDYGPLLG